MMDYSWPGNVRELRNNIEYAFAMGVGETLEIQDLTPELRGQSPHEETELENMEKTRLIKALEQSKGNKGLAAEICKMSRPTFWRKCKLHQIY